MTSKNPVLLFEGEFGRQVALRLATRVPEVAIHPFGEATANFAKAILGAGFILVALGRRRPTLCDALDKACRSARVPWSAAVLESVELFSGPVVVPDGPCYSCFRRRLRSHWMIPARESAWERALESADTESQGSGFPPAAAQLAAVNLAMDMRDGEAAAGRLRIVNLIHLGVEEERVVRVHNCERCGRERGSRRFVDDLARELDGWL